MTPVTLRASIDALGGDQSAYARAIGVAPRTVRHWLAGDRDIPEPVARLTICMLEFEAVRAKLGGLRDNPTSALSA